MNTEMIILGTILVSICGLPFLAVAISRNKLNQSLKRLLTEHVTEHRGNVFREEFIGKMGIALDEKQQLLFVVKQLPESDYKVVVNLNDMSSCKLDKECSNVKSDRGTYLLVESLTLHFIPKSKTQAHIKVPIFSIESDLHLSGELEFAERWYALISEELRLRIPTQTQWTAQPPAKRHKATA